LTKALNLVAKTEGVDQVVNRLTVKQSVLRTPKSTLAPEKSAYQTARRNQRHAGSITQPARRLQEVVDTQAARPEGARLASYTPQPMVAAIPQGAIQQAPQQMVVRRPSRPVPVAYVGAPHQPAMRQQAPMAAYGAPRGQGVAPARYDQPCMPNHAWPSYAAHPNYAALTYPKQYSPTAWPYIGPFYPYPQVPLGWRKVTLEWDDGWWMLDFKDGCCN
jgi:hypothetical protein